VYCFRTLFLKIMSDLCAPNHSDYPFFRSASTQMKPKNLNSSNQNGSLFCNLSIGSISLLIASAMLCQTASAAVLSDSVQIVSAMPKLNVVPQNTTPAIDYIPTLNVVPQSTTPAIDYIPKLNVVSQNTTTAIDYIPTLNVVPQSTTPAIDYIPTLTTPGSNLLPRPSNFVAQEVPEPFTIIGTIIGGTAAFRMKKKLDSSTKM
jgi:hypothetical protein